MSFSDDAGYDMPDFEEEQYEMEMEGVPARLAAIEAKQAIFVEYISKMAYAYDNEQAGYALEAHSLLEILAEKEQ